MTTSACFVFNARQISSRGAQRRAGGAGNSRFLGIGERAGSIGTHRCDELLATLRVRIVRNLSVEYLPPTHQPRYAPDGDQRKSPERTIGRRTNSSVLACPTPHCEKTPCHPVPHVPSRATTTRVRDTGTGTRPTYAAHPRLQAPLPRTHAAAQTPAAHPRRTCAPRTQERPEHTRTPHAPSIPGNKVFCLWQACVRDSGNKIAASAHGMGSGGLAVDAMAIGCLGVDLFSIQYSVIAQPW